MGGQEENAIRHPRRLPWGSCRLPSSSFTKPLSLPSTRSCLLPGRLILPGSSEKSEVLFFPCRAGTVFERRGCRGPSGMSAARGAGRSGTGGGVPSSPECAGSAGEGRRRARQCHGLIFIPISLCCVAILPAWTRRERGARVLWDVQGLRISCFGGTVSPPVWGRSVWVGAPRTL